MLILTAAAHMSPDHSKYPQGESNPCYQDENLAC